MTGVDGGRLNGLYVSEQTVIREGQFTRALWDASINRAGGLKRYSLEGGSTLVNATKAFQVTRQAMLGDVAGATSVFDRVLEQDSVWRRDGKQFVMANAVTDAAQGARGTTANRGGPVGQFFAGVGDAARSVAGHLPRLSGKGVMAAGSGLALAGIGAVIMSARKDRPADPAPVPDVTPEPREAAPAPVATSEPTTPVPDEAPEPAAPDPATEPPAPAAPSEPAPPKSPQTEDQKLNAASGDPLNPAYGEVLGLDHIRLTDADQKLIRELHDYMAGRDGDPQPQLAEAYVRAGHKYGIDPRLMVAIFGQESGFGNSKAYRERNNGWGVMEEGKVLVRFRTPEEGIERFAQILSRGYVNANDHRQPRTSVQAMGDKYCPVGAANDPTNLNGNWVGGVSRVYADLGGDPNVIPQHWEQQT